MTMHFHEVAQRIEGEGTIGAQDILALRRAGWADGTITAHEAEILFQINRNLAGASPAWSEFFREAICHFVVEAVDPRGYVTPEKAAWLIAQFERDSHLGPGRSLDVLVRIFETAQSTPETLRVWALEKIGSAICTASPTSASGETFNAAKVTRNEAEMLRRVLFSSGSDRPAGVSRREAELLFRLKDATLGADNAPEWKALFVQGVANYLQGFTSHTPLERERAAELEQVLRDHTSSIGRFIGRSGQALLHPNRLGKVFGRKAPRRDFNALVEMAAELTPDEQVWLDERLEANGFIDDYDQALLRFLAET